MEAARPKEFCSFTIKFSRIEIKIIKARKVRRSQQQRVKDVDSRENDILQANFANYGRSKLDRRLLLFLKDKFEMSE